MIPMNKCGIYMITSPSGKSYIGKSLNLGERLNKYKNLLCSDQQYIYHAILKYGWDNMKVTILYSGERNELSNDTLNRLEEEVKIKKRRSVIQLSIHGEFIKEWYSLTEASESLNISIFINLVGKDI